MTKLESTQRHTLSSARLLSALLLFLGLLFILEGNDLSKAQKITIVVTSITAWLWISEPIPIPVASLFPLAVLPLSGVLTADQVAQAYGSPLVLLMLGGFMLSAALSSSNTHRTLAHYLLRAVGTNNPRRILLGLMAAAAGFSMWISNTAAALMLLPVALAAAESMASRHFARAALLGVAYAASIGGILTPIGTPPNLILLETIRQQAHIEISFLSWMLWTAPVALALFPLVYWLLSRQLPASGSLPLPATAPLNSRQRRILMVFLITAGLWMLRTQPFGGWSAWLRLEQANDASVALLATLALFVWRDENKRPLMRWKDAHDVPWGILLLFAGGISIAKAFQTTGLSQALAMYLTGLQQWPVILLILAVALALTFLTEVTSNTATTAILLPILLAVAGAIQAPPLALLLPATLSASFAFMMPVATPPNAIVFSSGQVPIKYMMRTGLRLNLAGALLVTLATWALWQFNLLE